MHEREESQTVPSMDGFPLAVTVISRTGAEAAASGRPVVLISSATGTPRSFYLPFARFLVDVGGAYAAVTYDYRGIGDSRPQPLAEDNLRKGRHPLYDYDARTETDWAGDFDALVQFCRSRWPLPELVHVGQSVGAYLPPMSRSGNVPTRHLFVSANHAAWRFAKTRVKSIMFSCGFIPAWTRWYHYFPATKLNVCADLPCGVAHDWAKWIRDPRACCGDREIDRRFKQFNARVKFVASADDELATVTAFEEFIKLLPNAKDCELIELKSRRMDRPRTIGHMGFFAPRNKDLWPTFLPYILEGASVNSESLYRKHAKL